MAYTNWTKRSREKMSKIHLGKKLSEETKRKISLANKGHKHSEEVKKRISLLNKGKHLSPKTEFKKGHINSKKIRKKMSKSHKGERNYNWQGGLPKCIDCGKELTHYETKKCQSCYIKLLKKIRPIAWAKEKNPAWKNGKGKEPYSFNFNLSLKSKIRKRDNYQCQNKECNMTEEEHLIVYGKVLFIHHIDYDKKNCNENNLISLCMGCNTRVNFNRKYWKNIFRRILVPTIYSPVSSNLVE